MPAVDGLDRWPLHLRNGLLPQHEQVFQLIDDSQDEQNPHQGIQTALATAFQLTDCAQGQASPIGQYLLRDPLSQALSTDAPTQRLQDLLDRGKHKGHFSGS